MFFFFITIPFFICNLILYQETNMSYFVICELEMIRWKHKASSITISNPIIHSEAKHWTLNESNLELAMFSISVNLSKLDCIGAKKHFPV